MKNIGHLSDRMFNDWLKAVVSRYIQLILVILLISHLCKWLIKDF